MNNRTLVEKSETMTNPAIWSNLSLGDAPAGLSGTKKAINNLIAEGGESFYNYVDWLGLINDPFLIVLSSVHHYYFDIDDFKDTNTVINLKQLNQTKNIDFLFHSIYKIIPLKSNFIGCFLDNKKQYHFAINNVLSRNHEKNKTDPFENGIMSRIPFLNKVYTLIDSKPNRYLTRKNVTLLLEEQRFKVLDMTELNGLTYFHSQKTIE